MGTQFHPGGKQTIPPTARTGEGPLPLARTDQKLSVNHVTGRTGTELGNIAYPGPRVIRARDVTVGMTISERVSAKHPRPRKIVVESIGYADQVLRPHGEKIRVRRIFFNGNGKKKYDFRQELLLHFAPDDAPTGTRSDVREFTETKTTDAEKAANAAKLQGELAYLAALVPWPEKSAPVEALLDLSDVERPRVPAHVSEFADYAPEVKPGPGMHAVTLPPEIFRAWKEATAEGIAINLSWADFEESVKVESTPVGPLPKFDPDKVGVSKPTQRKTPPSVRYMCDAHVKEYRAQQEIIRKQESLAAIVAQYSK